MKKIKKILKESFFWTIARYVKMIFVRFILEIDLIKVFYHDYYKIRKYSGTFNRKQGSTLTTWLLFDIHRLEKGLVLKQTRPNFGVDSISRILETLRKNERKSFLDRHIALYAISILKEYDLYHKRINEIHIFTKDIMFNSYIECETTVQSGIEQVDVSYLDLNDYKTVVSSRFSCREYLDTPICPVSLNNAISLAISTPSVCNRQHWRVRHLTGDKCKEILSLQNGNAPFRDEINNVLLITSDLSYFITPFERYQQYIDGGMFAMNLLNSLHHNNIGSCALNWAASLGQDIDIYKKNIIPQNESVIMLIAIGNYDVKVNATSSTRLKLDNIFKQ